MVHPKLAATRLHWLTMITWQFCNYLAGQQLFPVFANYRPNWRCNNTNITTDSTFAKNCTIWEKCPEQDVQYDNVAFHSFVLDFDMMCGHLNFVATWISSAQFFGVLIGTILFGHLSDKFGRRSIGIFVVSGCIAMAALSGFTPKPLWQIYLALRFLVGSCAGGVLVVMYTFVNELILPQQRMLMRCIFSWVLETGVGWSRMLLTGICAALPNWRWASVGTAFAALPILPMLLLVLPESPTWLAKKGRHLEMQTSLNKIARINGHKQQLPVQHSDGADFPTSGTGASPDGKLYSVLDLFSSRYLTKTTIIMCLIWFTASISSYGNDLNSRTLAGDFFLNQVLFGIFIGLSKIALFLVDWYIPTFSRRWLHQGAQTVVVICFGALVALTLADNLPVVILVINLLGAVFIEFVWDACYLCAVEAYPTEIRSIGSGTASFMARIGALLAPQLAHLSYYWKPSPFLGVTVIGSVALIGSIFLLPETKGKDITKIEENVNNNYNAKEKSDKCPERSGGLA